MDKEDRPMASEEQLKRQLRQMIVARLFLNVEPDDIADDANLMDTYGIDSVNLFEIVVGLEDEFGISVADEDFSADTFATINNIAALVKRKRAE